MSATSEKQRMRDALRLTEGNLSSLIGVRFDNGATADNNVIVRGMVTWRDIVRKALGYINENDECICPKCGLRHGGRNRGGSPF